MTSIYEDIIAKVDEIGQKITLIKRYEILYSIKKSLEDANATMQLAILKLDYKAHMKECMPRMIKEKGDFKEALQACVLEWKEKTKSDIPE